jgi:curved DNA-binding protein CbpA
MMLTAYDILQIPMGTPVDDAKRAYYRLAKQYHPDVYKGPDAHEKMKVINLAYDAIKDGRGRWWTAPAQQQAPAPRPQPQAQPAPEKPSLAEMIRWANSHEFEVTNEYLLKMEVGGRDQYSKMKLDELSDTVGMGILKKACDAILGKYVTEDRLIGTALRWYLRGLKIDLAIRKAKVDDQFYRNKAKGRNR